MKYKFTIICLLLVPALTAFSQQWQQTTATPEGGGVTDLVVRESNGNIFVTTGSYNWPSVNGGIRRSANGGASWDNVFDAYNGRTIIDGADGNLYASVWPYPSNEGLYRSTDNGSTWNVLTSVPNGNNIFAIALSTNTPSVTIFAGTRQGVYRSTDNGFSWAYANIGLPVNAWVRDIEVDTSGIVAAATLSGLYTSEDNGDSWTQASGIAAGDTIVKLSFDYDLTSKMGETRLLSGSNHGNIYESFRNSRYTLATLLAIFSDDEMSGMYVAYLRSQNKKMLAAATYPSNSQGGGFRSSTDNGTTWQQNNSGLPGNNPQVSALSGTVDESGGNANVDFYLGLYQNSSVGAKVYSSTYTVTGIDPVGDLVPEQIEISQNYPNPFNPNTSITISLRKKTTVALHIYDVAGQKVRTLLDRSLAAGTHQVVWDGRNTQGVQVGSGIYIYRIQAEGFSQSRKMVLMR